MKLKKNWILFPVILLALAGMVMMGCGGGGDDELPPGPGPNPPGPNPPGPSDDFDPASITPPTGFDTVLLGDFTFTADGGNAQKQKGWVSNGYNGITTEVEIQNFIEAEYLWVWVKNEPSGSMQIVWQGNGKKSDNSLVDTGGWFQADILKNNGDPIDGGKVTVTEEQDGYAIKIKLADVMATTASNNSTADFTDATAGFKLLLCYYSPDLNGLGNLAAYLLLPTGTIAGWLDKTVTFNTNGADATPAIPASISVVSGYPLGSKYPVPAKTDNVFKGWFENTTEYDAYTPIATDVTLKAEWVDPCTVTFFYEDGDEVVITVGQGMKLGSKYFEPEAGRLNDAGTDLFDGWYTQANGNGSKVDADTIAPTATTEKYYAKWSPLAVVTFVLDGGVLANGSGKDFYVLLPAGEKMGAKFPTAVPAKIGYDFVAWKNGGSSYNGNSTINADITLTADWDDLEWEYLKDLGGYSGLDVLNSDTQKGWKLGSGGITLTDFVKAKYLILKIDGAVNTNPWGIGGISVIFNIDSAWEQADITDGNWATGFKDQIVYIVIDLTAHSYWDTYAGDPKDGKLIFQTWMKITDSPIAEDANDKRDVGYVGAYLVSEDLDLTDNSVYWALTDKGTDYGIVTKDNLGF